MPKPPKTKRQTGPDGKVRVHGKLSNGEGSIYRLPNGSWRATWHDRNGRRRYVRGRTRGDAIARRDQAVADDTAAPTAFSRDTTIAEFADWWLDNVAAHRVRPSSLHNYRVRLDRIRKTLGDTRVVELRTEGVATWLTGLAKSLAPGTVADTRTMLAQVLDEAVAVGLVPANVATRARPPKVVRKDARALTVDETKALLEAARGDRLAAAVWLLFTCGWRISEVLGLAWGDLDLDAGTATIRRSATYVAGQGAVLGPTKTRGALGVHHLSPGTVALLRARRQQQLEERLAAGPAWATHRYAGEDIEPVFTAPDGALMYRQIVTKVITRAAEAAGLDPRGIATHTGRRTVVTALYAIEGVDLNDVARHVGHTATATTASYVRDLGARPERTARAAYGLFDPPVT
ncbi:MAG: tyrosine-type recombinase/integrase [Acidimicrobiia bacterium]